MSRAWYEAHREEIRSYKREWSRAHREEINARARERRAQDPEPARRRQRAYEERHREEINARRRERRNAENVREYNRRYYSLHKDHLRALSRQRQKTYRDTHKEQIRKKCRKWLSSHPDYRTTYEAARRSPHEQLLCLGIID